MPIDEPRTPSPKPSRTGFAIAITLNVLVVVAILIGIPIEQSTHLELAIPLMAFSFQMSALGIVALIFSIVDLVTNRQRNDRRGAILAGVGIVLSLLPQHVGSALIHIAAHFLGWHIDF
jgi:hypothetical protein